MTLVHFLLYIVVGVLCSSIARQIGLDLTLKFLLLIFAIATIAVI